MLPYKHKHPHPTKAMLTKSAIDSKITYGEAGKPTPKGRKIHHEILVRTNTSVRIARQ